MMSDWSFCLPGCSLFLEMLTSYSLSFTSKWERIKWFPLRTLSNNKIIILSFKLHHLTVGWKYHHYHSMRSWPWFLRYKTKSYGAMTDCEQIAFLPRVWFLNRHCFKVALKWGVRQAILNMGFLFLHTFPLILSFFLFFLTRNPFHFVFTLLPQRDEKAHGPLQLTDHERKLGQTRELHRQSRWSELLKLRYHFSAFISHLLAHITNSNVLP